MHATQKEAVHASLMHLNVQKVDSCIVCTLHGSDERSAVQLIVAAACTCFKKARALFCLCFTPWLPCAAVTGERGLAFTTVL